MTHMRWLYGQSGHESMGYTRGVVQCVGGLRPWPIDMCSNNDAGRSQSETPTPCECEQGPMFATSPCAWVTAVQSTKHKEANTNMLLCGSMLGSCQQLHTLPCRVLLGWKISCWVASLPRSISCPPTTHIQVCVLHDINYSNRRKPSYPGRREKRATTAG